MTALYIILGVIAVIAVLLLCPIRVDASYISYAEVGVRYLFFKKTLLKTGGKKPTAAKKAASAPKHKKEKPKKEEKKKEYARPPLNELIPALRDALAKVLKKLGGSVYLKKAVFRCRVGSDDPAKTALLYGAVSGAAGDIFALLSGIKRRSKKAKTIDFTVEPDFIYDSFDLAVDVSVTAVPAKLIGVAAVAWLKYLKIKKTFKEIPGKDPGDDAKENEA